MQKIKFLESESFQNDFTPKLRETLLELKPGYKHGIRVKSEATGNIWISSTNKLEDRNQTIEYIIRQPEKWNSVWRELFEGTDPSQFSVELFPEISTTLLTEGHFQVTSEKKGFLRKICGEYLKFRERQDDNNAKALIKKFLEEQTGLISINVLLEKIDQILEN